MTVDSKTIPYGSVLLEQAFVETVVGGVRGDDMLNALARRARWVLVVDLAIARGDGRTWSNARAVGAAAEVGWLLLALSDGKQGHLEAFMWALRQLKPFLDPGLDPQAQRKDRLAPTQGDLFHLQLGTAKACMQGLCGR